MSTFRELVNKHSQKGNNVILAAYARKLGGSWLFQPQPTTSYTMSGAEKISARSAQLLGLTPQKSAIGPRAEVIGVGSVFPKPRLLRKTLQSAMMHKWTHQNALMQPHSNLFYWATTKPVAGGLRLYAFVHSGIIIRMLPWLACYN